MCSAPKALADSLEERERERGGGERERVDEHRSIYKIPGKTTSARTDDGSPNDSCARDGAFDYRNVLGQLGLEYGIEILARPLSDQAIGVGKCREAADLIRVLEHQARRHCLSLLIGLILPSRW
jgi:hypothetical protein